MRKSSPPPRAAPAVFLLRGDDPQAEPYVSKTANLRRRLHRLLGPPDQTRRLNLRDRVRTVEFTATGSDFESGFLLYRVLRTAFPKTYTDRLRIRFAPLLKLHMENEYPRASITTRLGRLGGTFSLLRAFPIADCGGKVRQRFTRFLQDAALHRRSPSRSRISRMHLFRNEDVSGAVLQRLH